MGGTQLVLTVPDINVDERVKGLHAFQTAVGYKGGQQKPMFPAGSSWWWKQKPFKFFFFLSLFFALFIITHNIFLNPLGVASGLSYPWCPGKLCDSGQRIPVHRSAPRGPQQLGPPESLQTGPCRRYGLLLEKVFLFYLLQLLSLSFISCPSLSLTRLILPSP